MMKLFAIYIGGELEGANIELHDMRFVAAPSIGETYQELRRQWWGKPQTLHIDCWAELDVVDGYKITLRQEPYLGKERLFYINLGGYDPTEFVEKHKNVFIVAPDTSTAKKRALALINSWKLPHRDEMYEADQVFHLSAISSPALHLHFEHIERVRSLVFKCSYLPIG